MTDIRSAVTASATRTAFPCPQERLQDLQKAVAAGVKLGKADKKAPQVGLLKGGLESA
ncbi:MAG: hypothetical protein AAF085_09075 [Planctomycetota bacterium]